MALLHDGQNGQVWSLADRLLQASSAAVAAHQSGDGELARRHGQRADALETQLRLSQTDDGPVLSGGTPKACRILRYVAGALLTAALVITALGMRSEHVASNQLPANRPLAMASMFPALSQAQADVQSPPLNPSSHDVSRSSATESDPLSQTTTLTVPGNLPTPVHIHNTISIVVNGVPGTTVVPTVDTKTTTGDPLPPVTPSQTTAPAPVVTPASTPTTSVITPGVHPSSEAARQARQFLVMSDDDLAKAYNALTARISYCSEHQLQRFIASDLGRCTSDLTARVDREGLRVVTKSLRDQLIPISRETVVPTPGSPAEISLQLAMILSNPSQVASLLE